MNTQSNKNNYIISVESRKGGVGKTTAALCLGKLLLQKGFEVLLLDTDITGTNVVDAINSAFWKNRKHIVNVGKDKRKHANLLEMFEREFMAGKGIPDFEHEQQKKEGILTWEKGLINVIGSEIYSSENDELICKPSILFDELHAFWFVKYIKEICKQFRERVGDEKPTAIVIDNSPGYVGIGPAIQEWLIDEGVDKNKFLFVSSLDHQDLTACLKTMEYVHSRYDQKWSIAKKLDLQKSSKDSKTPNWNKTDIKFVIRLLESERYDAEKEGLGFYLKRGLCKETANNEKLGDVFNEQVGKYQGIVVNRVAHQFKEGWWTYSINGKDESDEKISCLLTGNHYSDIDTNIMVEYSEYIDCQFTPEDSVQTNRKVRRHPEEFKWVWKSARMEFDSCGDKNLSYKHLDYHSIFDRLKRYQVIIDNFLERIASIPIYTLQPLVQQEWQPKAIGQNFSRLLSRAFIREFDWFPENWERHNDSGRLIHSVEYMREMIQKECQISFDKKGKYGGKEIWEELLCSGTVVWGLVTQNWGNMPLEKMDFEFGHLIGQICSIEIKHWCSGKRKGKDSIAMFLANDRLSKDEIKEKFFRKMLSPIRYSFDEDESGICKFYEAFAKAQARVLDLDKDVRFLISIIEQAIRDDGSKQALLPYIEGLANKVIVNKTISHEQGMEECRKGFRIAESLEQFEGILSNILNKWGIE